MLNPKQIEKAMKRMGIHTEEIDAEEVLIKCKDKDIVIKEPSVSKIKMGGNETFQIIGIVSERQKNSEEDIKLVIEQTGCTEEEAKKALEETGDLAEAIMKLKNI